MKPKEFDELVRQKFDQNDFAYSPGNWDRLAEQLDGRAKKRSMIMWLWMPALGMAASVALAIGVTGMLRFNVPANEGEYTQTSKFVKHQPAHEAVAIVTEEAAPAQIISSVAKPAHINRIIKNDDKTSVAKIGISMNNALASKFVPVRTVVPVSLAAVPKSVVPQSASHKPKKTEPIAVPAGYNTFAPRVYAAKSPAKFSIILSGGINQGSHTSGYAAGATVRRMVNDKVYVESDVAFASSDFVQSTQFHNPPAAAKVAAGAKVSKVESSGNPADKVPSEGPLVTGEKPYSLQYAQVSPSIGYKLMNRLSVAVGPDFQRVLADNRPAPSTEDRNNIQVAPLFDVGFIGKTECKLTNRVKAAVSYRKGINGIITPSDKYIDRDYLQFQLRCVIFNK